VESNSHFAFLGAEPLGSANSADQTIRQASVCAESGAEKSKMRITLHIRAKYTRTVVAKRI
jgi:hypothetical protein